MPVWFLAALAAMILQGNPLSGAPMPERQCAITGGADDSCPAVDPFQAIGTSDYDAVRSDSGLATAPIDVWNRCRYVDNAATHTSAFVPFKSKLEWDAVIDEHPSYLDLVTCARPTAINITPNSACANPSPAFQPVGLPYARTGTVITQRATFTCASTEGCPDWTQTVQVNFTALNSDTANPNWSSGTPTYLGNPPNRDSCSTPAGAACGPANGVATSTAPSSGLCNAGTPSAVDFHPSDDGEAYWSWSCAGTGGGASVSCSAPLPPPAVCGDWTPRENDRLWSAITNTPDGAKLFAASAGQIYASTDSGASWTPLPNPNTFTFDPGIHWHRIATSADGTKVVALLSAGQIHTSTNSGLTWTPHEFTWNWGGATMSADGAKIAVSAPLIYTSTNGGTSWTYFDDDQRIYTSIAGSTDGTKLAVPIHDGKIFISANSGASWTYRGDERHWRDIAMSADGTKLAAVVYGGKVYTSTDSGVTWTTRSPDRLWTAIASSANGSRLVAVAHAGQIYVSTNGGASWIAQECDRQWIDITLSADGTHAAAVVFGGKIYTTVLPP